MLLKFEKFSGVAPKVNPRKLAVGMAQTAMNVDLTSRTIKPTKSYTSVVSGLATGAMSTIYRFGQDLISDTQYWFHWTADVDIVKGAIANDQTERTYFTHPTLGPRVTNNTLALVGGSGDYPWNSYKLGVPAPTVTPNPTVVVNGTGSAETRIYAYTYVTSFGEEGPPSPTSAAIDVSPTNSTVRLTNLPTIYPTGYNNITAKRIYRTFSGNVATEFQLVDEIPIGQGTYDDSVASANLQETLPSLTWAPPPDTAFGIVQMANGITVLFDGYDVYPSEAFQPYAYPIAYSQSVDYPIIGGASLGSSAVILTTGNPYLLTGSDPSAMSLVKLESNQSCVSKRSIAAIEGGVIYASPDGLMLVTGSGQVTNITSNFFDHATWQALTPASIHGYVWDGKYVGFYAGTGGFVYDPQQGEAAFSMLGFYASAGFSDLIQDTLYLKVGTNIVKWSSSSSYLSAVWRSGILELPKPINPGCAQVRSSAYPVTFKLYADSQLKHTQTVANDSPFYLPSGYRASTLEVQVETSSGEVTMVALADSPTEMAGA